MPTATYTLQLTYWQCQQNQQTVDSSNLIRQTENQEKLGYTVDMINKTILGRLLSLTIVDESLNSY